MNNNPLTDPPRTTSKIGYASNEIDVTNQKKKKKSRKQETQINDHLLDKFHHTQKRKGNKTNIKEQNL